MVSVGRMVSLWPVVVSFLGAVCLCRMVRHSSSGEGVGCVAVAVSSFGAGCLCRMVSLWDWLPVVSTLDTLPAVSLWDWLPWSVPSTHCQPVSLCLVSVGRMVSLWDVLTVACGLVAVVSVGRMVCLWDDVPQFQR